MGENDRGEVSYEEEKRFFQQHIADYLSNVQAELDELRGADGDRKADLQSQLTNSFSSWSSQVTPAFSERFPDVKPLPPNLPGFLQQLQQLFDEIDKLPVKVYPDLNLRQINLRLEW